MTKQLNRNEVAIQTSELEYEEQNFEERMNQRFDPDFSRRTFSMQSDTKIEDFEVRLAEANEIIQRQKEERLVLQDELI